MLVATLVVLVGVEDMLSATTPNIASRHHLLKEVVPRGVPPLAHVLAFSVAIGLLVISPSLLRGKERAAQFAVVGLMALAALNLLKGLDWGDAALDTAVVVVIVLGSSAYEVGSRARPRVVVVCVAVAAWAAALALPLVAPALSERGQVLTRDVHHVVGHAERFGLTHPAPSVGWGVAVDLLILVSIAFSAVALRSSLRPADGRNTHDPAERLRARHILDLYGNDSLSPFVMRPDKAFFFSEDGMIAYRVIRDTAVVSGDPIAAPGRAGAVLEGFRDLARSSGWRVVLWGASGAHLDDYRARRLHAVRVGEEAFINPGSFTLEGRAVRKLRQSVHRMERHGWRITVSDGADLTNDDLDAVDAHEREWRAQQPAVIGFVMGMGPYVADCRPADLYARAFDQDGKLRSVMRFAEHAGRLSLDTMHRIGETPNGLNEALICHALERARERGIPEVSLNYAGLSHLARHGHAGRGAVTYLSRVMSRVIGQRFRMAGLVRFDEKFPVEWRPRFMVHESRLGLPRATLRVLQAEGYVPSGDRSRGATARAERGFGEPVAASADRPTP